MTGLLLKWSKGVFNPSLVCVYYKIVIVSLKYAYKLILCQFMIVSWFYVIEIRLNFYGNKMYFDWNWIQ